MTVGEKISDFREVTEAEKSVLEKADAAWKRPPQSFIDMWNAAAGLYGCYNEATGYFELNGLTDITYEQALNIYEAGRLSIDVSYGFYASTNIRTNLPAYPGKWLLAASNLTFYCSKFEVVNTENIIKIATLTFAENPRLKVILGTLAVEGNTGNAFKNLPKLESVQLKLNSKATNVDLRQSPCLSLESFQYMITNASNTATTTVTIHPDIYAKLQDETNTEWHVLVARAAEKNITFATS